MYVCMQVFRPLSLNVRVSITVENTACSNIVGRTLEIQAIMKRLSNQYPSSSANSKHTYAFILFGEAGVGKSAVISACKLNCKNLKIQYLMCQGDAYEVNAPFLAVKILYSRMIRLRRERGLEDFTAAFIIDMLGELKEYAFLVNDFIEMTIPPPSSTSPKLVGYYFYILFPHLKTLMYLFL
jgi:hypothetical protein